MRKRSIVLGWFAVISSGLWVVAAADSLAPIRARGYVIWGGDAEGGAPFVYPQSGNPTQVSGCDVEIMDWIARELGVTARFAQGQWDKLPDLLDRGDMDLVLSGYEWTAPRADRFGTSIPYAAYELQLLARRDDPSLRSWEDLRRKPGQRRRRVAVLGGSAAQQYLETHFAADVEIVSFDGVTDAMRAVELAADGIDANLQDLPIVQYYEKGFPSLHRVGPPVGMGYYVILTRRGDKELLAAVNDVIVQGLRDGTLRRILQPYGMWNQAQERRALECGASGGFLGRGLGEVPDRRGPEPTQTYLADRGWSVVRERSPLLLRAALMTVKLSVVAMPLAILMGLALALGRLYGPRWLSGILSVYIEVVRGTPLVLQLYVVFFLLPELGLRIEAFWAAILGLAVNYSAYEAEIYRAGLQAIPRGQMEAALALGMSPPLALRRIVIPQATRIVIPPVTNDFIALFKDTAVCSVITIVELSKEYYIHARSTGAIVELGLVTALLYLSMSFPLSLLTRYWEHRLTSERTA